MPSNNIKLVVFVPTSHADIVRQALGEVGAGKIGNYDFCSFSSRGFGRFRKKVHPYEEVAFDVYSLENIY